MSNEFTYCLHVYMFMSPISVSISVCGSVAVTAVVQVFRVAALAAQFLEPTKSNLFATEAYWRLIKSVYKRPLWYNQWNNMIQYDMLVRPYDYIMMILWQYNYY